MSKIQTFKIQRSIPDPKVAILARGNRYVGTAPFDDEIGQHLALLPKEFDPKTDEVIVVKKNARRVFLQTVGMERDSTGLFLSMPRWCPAGWTGDFVHVPTLITNELADQDVLEFVAVCTHRPPEPEKPVEDELIPASVVAAACGRLCGFPIGCVTLYVAASIPGV